MPPVREQEGGFLMRPRERLLEVLMTVNPSLYEKEVLTLRYAYSVLKNGKAPSTGETIALWRIALNHPSPHLRQLASEAIHYIKREGS